MIGFSERALTIEVANKDNLKTFNSQRESIYQHMRRYGINRDDIVALRRLYETYPPHSFPHVNIASEKLLNPGEHYRIEVDSFVITMIVPDAPANVGSWIWPYTETIKPEMDMQKLILRENGKLKLADLSWNQCKSTFQLDFLKDCKTHGLSIIYRILKPQEQLEFSTPEKLRQLSRKIMRDQIIPAEKVEDAIRSGQILNGSDNKIYLDSEIIVINGRVWVRDAMDSDSDRIFYYKTRLSKDRMLGLSFGLPTYNYNANPEPSNHPAAIKRAAALMEELISSLRIAKVDNDNTPDPFVIERVAPAPLPVREALPSNQ